MFIDLMCLPNDDDTSPIGEKSQQYFKTVPLIPNVPGSGRFIIELKTEGEKLAFCTLLSVGEPI